jgi:glycosyltransferase involved in cell wall biosynthesis
MRILYTTTVGLTMTFFKSFVRQLLDEGHFVDIATNENTHKVDDCYRNGGCNIYQISWSRTPLSPGNFRSIDKLKTIIKKNKYDVVHCHTPIAAMCTRIACRGLRKNGVKVIYTAHGFHFYKGAPLKNWLLYYPIEKLCSRWTDVLITINKEDYALACKKMKARRVEYVRGVGIDVAKFKNTVVDKQEKRREIGVPVNAFVLLSVGELNANKNHEVVVRAIAQIRNPDIHYAIAGRGDKHDYLISLANELGIAEQLHLLGYRSDVAELYKTADAYVHPSFREGLPVSIMEAMASGLPVVCSKIRGNVDLIINNQHGVLCDSSNKFEFACAIKSLAESTSSCMEVGANNKYMSNEFDIISINRQMMEIYGFIYNDGRMHEE